MASTSWIPHGWPYEEAPGCEVPEVPSGFFFWGMMVKGVPKSCFETCFLNIFKWHEEKWGLKFILGTGKQFFFLLVLLGHIVAYISWGFARFFHTKKRVTGVASWALPSNLGSWSSKQVIESGDDNVVVKEAGCDDGGWPSFHFHRDCL